MPVQYVFSKSINGTYRVFRMTIIGDATSWSIILTTLEVTFTIVIFFIIQATVLGLLV
jgi:hypothetical protein